MAHSESDSQRGLPPEPGIDIPTLGKKVHALKDNVAASTYLALYREFQLLRSEAEIENWSSREIVERLVQSTDGQHGPGRAAVIALAYEFFPSLVPVDEIPVPKELSPVSLESSPPAAPIDERVAEIRHGISNVGKVSTSNGATTRPPPAFHPPIQLPRQQKKTLLDLGRAEALAKASMEIDEPSPMKPHDRPTIIGVSQRGLAKTKGDVTLIQIDKGGKQK